MEPNSKVITTLIKRRIENHFDNADAEEIVKRSQGLMSYPTSTEIAVVPTVGSGPVLIHAKPKRVPLNAYLASALTGLDPIQKSLVVHLSDVVNLVCREVDIDLYEPRKKTDPVHNAEVSDSEVFKIDKERVVSSDLLIHLCHFPSTGSGEELSFAHDALVPIILISPGSQRVSRMVTGIPSLKIEIRYQEPEELRSLLEDRLLEVRPFLEQRRLTLDGFSENVVGAKIKELRLDAGVSMEDLSSRVGLTTEGLARIEENVDTISNPSLTQLRLIATVLKTTVAELVNPDYHETILASIQSLMSEHAASAAARFRGVSDKDTRALMRRFLARLSNELEERWHGL